MDEDEEANMVIDWNQESANVAFEEQRKAAEKAEKEREAAEMALLAQYNYAQTVDQTGSEIYVENENALENLSTDGSNSLMNISGYPSDVINGKALEERTIANGSHLPSAKKMKTVYRILKPWEAAEDLVLTFTIDILIEKRIDSEKIFEIASRVLNAGAAVIGMTRKLSAQDKRSASACKKRYNQLEKAYLMSQTMQNSFHFDLLQMKSSLERIVSFADKKSSITKGLVILYLAMQNASANIGAILEKDRSIQNLAYGFLSRLDSIRSSKIEPSSSHGNSDELSNIVAANLSEQSKDIIEFVKKGCGSSVTRVISQRIPSYINKILDSTTISVR